MQQAYRIAVVYFSLFGLLLLGSGAVLFAMKIGFTPDAVRAYYLGSGFSAPKSAYGLLETATPHFLAMGLFIMVTGHFLLFAEAHAKRRARRVVAALFFFALLDIVSGFFILQGAAAFLAIKLIAFTMLQLLGLYLTGSVIFAAFRGIRRNV